MIILKVTKNQDFTLSLEDTFFEKLPGGGGGAQINTPSRFRVKARTFCHIFRLSIIFVPLMIALSLKRTSSFFILKI